MYIVKADKRLCFHYPDRVYFIERYKRLMKISKFGIKFLEKDNISKNMFRHSNRDTLFGKLMETFNV